MGVTIPKPFGMKRGAGKKVWGLFGHKEMKKRCALPRAGALQKFEALYGSVPPTPVLGVGGKVRPPGGREGAARRR